MFVVCSEQLLVNELTPRVHNSGHWTQSGSQTCQFENYLRAIAGAALGSTKPHGISEMVNLIGSEKPALNALSATSNLYWYDKSVRSGRTLVHMNSQASDSKTLNAAMLEFRENIDA